METALADLVRSEIVGRFGAQGPRLGKGTTVATFTCPSRSLGDVIVETEGQGVIVSVTGMWHSHFDDGTDEEIVTECAGFLDDLFHDKVVVYVGRRDGRMLGGGTFDPDLGAGSSYRRLTRRADEVRAGTWSAPWVDDGIDEDAETALADLARDEIARRFTDQRPEIGEGFRVATFTCPSPSLGHAVVEAVNTGLLVEVGSHSLEFDGGTPEETVGKLARFLDDMFHNKVVFYVAHSDGRLPGFGRFNADNPVPPYFRRLSREADDIRAETWSGPWSDEGT
jgi:hypothetical protein